MEQERRQAAQEWVGAVLRAFEAPAALGSRHRADNRRRRPFRWRRSTSTGRSDPAGGSSRRRPAPSTDATPGPVACCCSRARSARNRPAPQRPGPRQLLEYAGVAPRHLVPNQSRLQSKNHKQQNQPQVPIPKQGIVESDNGYENNFWPIAKRPPQSVARTKSSWITIISVVAHRETATGAGLHGGDGRCRR